MKKRRPRIQPPSRSFRLWGKTVQIPIRRLTGRWVTTMTLEKDSALGPFSEVFGPGRFNPPRSFPILTLALDNEACRAAIRILAIEDEELFASKVVVAMQVHLSAVLDLCDPGTRTKLGLTRRDFLCPEQSLTQSIGVAARKADLEGILYPVGVQPGPRNLAVILERVTTAELTATSIDWPWEGCGALRASP